MGMFDGAFQGLAGGVVGGLTSLAGGLMTNAAQKDIAQNAMNFSAQQSQAQMDFQERMRKTQYQTAVEDLKAADLNPMLAYTQGGAGTPAGAAAVGQQAQLRNPTEGLAHSASQIANIKADLDIKHETANRERAQTTATEKQAQFTDALTASEVLRMPNISQEFKRLYAETLLKESQREQTSALTSKTLYEMPEAIQKGKYYNQYGTLPYELRDFSQAASNAASAFGSLNPFKKR